MKILFTLIVLNLLFSSSAIPNELSGINKFTGDGYKIISEDIVANEVSNSFIKTFTLQKVLFRGPQELYKESLLVICNFAFGSDGYLDGFECIKQ